MLRSFHHQILMLSADYWTTVDKACHEINEAKQIAVPFKIIYTNLQEIPSLSRGSILLIAAFRTIIVMSKCHK